jgi:anaerobic selenocysteine-containing dehydrogenase
MGEADALKAGPPVTAMLVQNTNPAVVCPELNKVHTGLKREDLFLCVHEQFMTETAAFADIVLPATMFLEHDDLYTASGHSILQVARKLISPKDQCRDNHFVICELARRLGARHEGFTMSVCEIIEETLRRSGVWDLQKNIDRGGQDFAPAFEQAHFLDGFVWPDRKFRFKPDWASLGERGAEMPVLPDHFDVIDKATPDRPFRLITAPARTFLNSTFTETPGSILRERRPTVLIHPQDFATLQLQDEDRVMLGNANGTVVAFAKKQDGHQAGVVILEGLWPNKYFESGLGINALTSAAPGFPAGGAVFHDTAVWIRRVTTN